MQTKSHFDFLFYSSSRHMSREGKGHDRAYQMSSCFVRAFFCLQKRGRKYYSKAFSLSHRGNLDPIGRLEFVSINLELQPAPFRHSCDKYGKHIWILLGYRSGFRAPVHHQSDRSVVCTCCWKPTASGPTSVCVCARALVFGFSSYKHFCSSVLHVWFIFVNWGRFVWSSQLQSLFECSDLV